MIVTTASPAFTTSSALIHSPAPEGFLAVCAAANEDLSLEVVQLQQGLQARELEIASYVDQLRSQNEQLRQQLHSVQQAQTNLLQKHAEKRTSLQSRIALLQSRVAAARQEMASASAAASKLIDEATKRETDALNYKSQSLEQNKRHFAQYVQKQVQEAEQKMRRDIKATCVLLHSGYDSGVEGLKRLIANEILSLDTYIQQSRLKGEREQALREKQDYLRKWLPILDQAIRDCLSHQQV